MSHLFCLKQVLIFVHETNYIHIYILNHSIFNRNYSDMDYLININIYRHYILSKDALLSDLAINYWLYFHEIRKKKQKKRRRKEEEKGTVKVVSKQSS